MKKYDIIFEALREKVDSGELTIEDAQILNDVAFEKYCDDDTEYEEVQVTVEGYYDGHIKSTENDIELIKKMADKRIASIDKQIKKCELEKVQVKKSLESRLKPFEKKLTKYETLNREDPDGKKAKKRTLVAAAGLTAAGAAAMFIPKYKQKNSDSKSDEE